MEKKMLQPIEAGNKYGKNTVLEPVYHMDGNGAKPRIVWKCKCECGRIHTLKATQLRNPEKRLAYATVLRTFILTTAIQIKGYILFGIA